MHDPYEEQIGHFSGPMVDPWWMHPRHAPDHAPTFSELGENYDFSSAGLSPESLQKVWVRGMSEGRCSPLGEVKRGKRLVLENEDCDGKTPLYRIHFDALPKRNERRGSAHFMGEERGKMHTLWEKAGL